MNEKLGVTVDDFDHVIWDEGKWSDLLLFLFLVGIAALLSS
jgi:hypothetical protein